MDSEGYRYNLRLYPLACRGFACSVLSQAAEQFRRAAELKPGESKYLDNMYRPRLQGG